MDIDADYIEQSELDASHLLVATISHLRARVADLEAKLAAAPMLLEALRKVQKYYRSGSWEGPEGVDNFMSKAIAAAEGRER